MFKNGILCFSGVLMLSMSHKKNDLNLLIKAFDKTCENYLAVSRKKSFKSLDM